MAIKDARQGSFRGLPMQHLLGIAALVFGTIAVRFPRE